VCVVYLAVHLRNDQLNCVTRTATQRILRPQK
jgi:hypothetical protein